MCVDICVCVYVFTQDPDPGSDPKKIIPDPQHCWIDRVNSGGRGRNRKEQNISKYRSTKIQSLIE